MTQAERASLERLEDNLGKRLDGIAETVNGIDTRLRDVEIAVAEQRGANVQRAANSTSRVQWVGVAVAAAVIVVALPAAVLAIVNLIGAAGG